MQRNSQGRYEITAAGGEQVRAFIPAPLPPRPPLRLEGNWLQTLEAASLALGGLEKVYGQLPDTDIFLYSYVRKEAVVSSQIEGTQSSLSDLLLHELSAAPGVPVEDAAEVSNYVAALQHGLARLREGFPLSNRLVREIHGILLSTGRGRALMPGEFRRSQNWIGGTRPGDARFVPPPHNEVQACMAALEKFLHAEGDGIAPLLRSGLAHVQFETIHPFLDGNGRVGRLLIILLLCDAGVLREPLLYPSLYFKRHRARYYQLLNEVRQSGDWELWLEFFLEGMRESADDAATTINRLNKIFESDRARIQPSGRRAAAALRVHQTLMQRPLLSIPAVIKDAGLSYPGAAAAFALLVELGIAREIPRRPKLFVYDEYLAVLNEGTEVG